MLYNRNLLFIHFIYSINFTSWKRSSLTLGWVRHLDFSCFIHYIFCFYLLGVYIYQWTESSWEQETSDHLNAAAAAAKSLQLCPTLCDPIDGSPPGSPIPGILQARTLEWVAISFSNVWKWKVKGKSLSHVRLLVTPWTTAHQAPPSMGFSRQEYWSGVPLPSPDHLNRCWKSLWQNSASLCDKISQQTRTRCDKANNGQPREVCS